MATDREDSRWWREKYADPDKRGKKVLKVVGVLREQSAPWRAQMKLNARFYGDSIEHAMSPRSFRGRRTAGSKAARLTLNVLKNAVDTRVAMLTHDEIRISCVTTGEDWDFREKAELTEQAIAGCFYETDFDVIEQRCAYDSAIFEPGWAYFYEDDSDPANPRPAAERVMPWEVEYSDEDALYGEPQSIYRVKWRDRESLKEEYPDFATEIGKSTGWEGWNDMGESAVGSDVGCELVPCIAAWHLPRIKPKETAAPDEESEEPAEDDGGSDDEEIDEAPVDPSAPKVGGGRYVYQVGSVVLVDHEYSELGFPLEPLFAQLPTSGLKGISLVEEVSPIQKSRNVVSQRIDRGIHLMGQPHWLVEANSKLNTNHIDNQNSSIWRYSGVKPEAIAPSAAAPEMYSRESVLGNEIYNCSGISPQLAQGQVPANLESGEAQRVHADIASARFRPTYKLLQDFRLRAARQFVRLMNRISKRNPKFFVKPHDHDLRDAVIWAEARMNETDYSLRLAPTNQLADDPEGRDALIQDLINGATIPQRDGMRLLAQNRSDLLGYLKEQPWYASYQYTQKAITAVLRGKKPLPPVRYLDLPAALAAAQTAYLDAAVGGCPQGRLDALDVWMQKVKDIQDQQAPPEPPAGAPGAPPPPAPGGPMSVASHMAAPLAAA